MTAANDPHAALRAFKKNHDFFVGIDSDGCVFDSMEVKQKECFIPNIIEYYGLAAISKYAREVAEFVNLYSKYRGINRFPALTKTLDLLAERPEVAARNFELPRLQGVRDWLDRETKLGNPALKRAGDATGDPDLSLCYAWSEAVNATVGRVVKDVPPFPFVVPSLELLKGKADVMVVSATPGEALEREWSEHGLSKYVGLIAGQELGVKKEHLQFATEGKWTKDKVLMVGDAPGDRKAAEAVGVLFYPIDPGYEDESWRRFHDEALPRFFAGTYAGAYMDEQVARFESLLPEKPPWSVVAR
jgi:phosphoglycolate phosphatase-like HAD superfamily hydrolase